MYDEQDRKPDYIPEDEDDLQQIKGIGSSTAEKLKSHGIHRYQDLMKYTPEDLENLLKDELPFATSKRTAGWIEEARELQEKKFQFREPAPAQEDTPEEESNGGSESRMIPNIPVYSNWREVADFFVSFGYRQNKSREERLTTRAYHSQEDRSNSWDGVAAEELIQWMVRQAQLPEAAAQIQVRAMEESESITIPGVSRQLELNHVWVEGQPQAGEPGAPEARIRVRCELQVIEIEESALDEESGFVIEYYLINRVDNQSTLIATTQGHFTAGRSTYPVMQSFRVPPIGDYRLYLVARILDPHGAMTHLQGPVIHVKQIAGQSAP